MTGCTIDDDDNDDNDHHEHSDADHAAGEIADVVSGGEVDELQLACGSGTCNHHETWETCPEDCQCNFDGICDGAETGWSCPADCTCFDEDICSVGEGATRAPCPRGEAECSIVWPEAFGPGVRLTSPYIAKESAGLDLNGDGEPTQALRILSIYDDTFDSILEDHPLLAELDVESERPGALHVYLGELGGGGDWCPWGSDAGECAISPQSWDCNCERKMSLPLTIIGDQLVAGGFESRIPFELPSCERSYVVRAAQLTAKWWVDEDGLLHLDDVKFGGALDETTLIAVLAEWISFCADPHLIRSFVSAIPPDIDVNLDGEAESYSFVFSLSAVPARLTPGAPD